MPIILNNKDGEIRINAVDLSDRIDHIPAMVYSIGRDDNGVFLKKRYPNFNEPSKIYGQLNEDRRTIIDEFDRHKDESMGVLFYGEKGSGKTMMAQSLCNHYINMGLPVLIVDEPQPAGLIREVVELMDPVIVLFDEFAKNFPEQSDSRPDQLDLLDLFSSQRLNHTLFLVLENDLHYLSTYLKDRPGRLKFSIGYRSIDEEGLKELLDDYDLQGKFRKHIYHYAVNTSFDVAYHAIEIASQYTQDQYEDFLRRMRIINLPEIGILSYEPVEIRDYQGESIPEFNATQIAKRSNGDTETVYYSVDGVDSGVLTLDFITVNGILERVHIDEHNIQPDPNDEGAGYVYAENGVIKVKDAQMFAELHGKTKSKIDFYHSRRESFENAENASAGLNVLEPTGSANPMSPSVAFACWDRSTARHSW